MMKAAATGGKAAKDELPLIVQLGLASLLETVHTRGFEEVVLYKASKSDKLGLVCDGASEVLIHELREGSIAAVSGALKKGMLVKAVNGEQVSSAVDATAKMKAAFPVVKLSVFTPPPPASPAAKNSVKSAGAAVGASERPPVALQPVRRGVLISLEFILDACASYAEINPEINKVALEVFEGSAYTGVLLSQYATGVPLHDRLSASFTTS